MFLCLSLSGCVLFPKKLDSVALAKHLEGRSFEVIQGNTGKYMSPFTTDGVAAAWVEKSIQAKLGASVGSISGTFAAQSVADGALVATGPFGAMLGAEIGRRVALSLIGGEAVLRQSSDLSFNRLDQMALWLVATHGNHPKFDEIMNATFEIYPYLREKHDRVIRGKL